MTTLEILYAARESIANPRSKWDFGWWPSCTCGHIYRGATGVESSVTGVAVDPPPQVAQAFKVIVRLLELPIPTDVDCDEYASAVSHATAHRAKVNPDGAESYAKVEREHGLSLIDDAITALEAEYERNRLDVLAQTKRIVDNADVREVVTA